MRRCVRHSDIIFPEGGVCLKCVNEKEHTNYIGQIMPRACPGLDRDKWAEALHEIELIISALVTALADTKILMIKRIIEDLG